MTTNEIELICEALRLSVGYSDSNPDVGWGPSLETLLQGILNRCGIHLNDREIAIIIGVYEIKGYRKPR